MAMPYPAYNNSSHYPPDSYNSYGSSVGKLDNVRAGMGMSRTPSPTPSEAKALNEPLFTMKQLTNWRFWIRKEWIKYYIILAIILIITALISIFHTQIVDKLTPVTNWLHGLKYGWLVPIGVLFVISFPPLFGHEIVAVLCGLVWGLWIGFGIVCAGTFLGEVGNFYAFKWCCRARGEKMERTQIPYACLARCVRVGGFKIALIARFSAIPGHFTTAVFSTCGMNIFVFSIAAILSLPKQFITVYLGVILKESSTGKEDTKSKIISDSVLAATFLVTILAMWYIFHQMALMKPMVIYERRKARQGKLQGINLDLYGNRNDSESEIAYGSTEGVDIPLTANGVGSSSGMGAAGVHPRYDYELQQKQRKQTEYAAQRRRWEQEQRGRPGASNANPFSEPQRYNPYSPREGEHQQWDEHGRAVGYTPGPGGPVLYAPQPQPARANTGGRTPIQAGAYMSPPPMGGQQHMPGEAEVYAHGRTPAVAREGTGDEVGWDMQQMREVRPQQYTTSPPPMQQPQRQQTIGVQQGQGQAQAQAQMQMQDPGTPTQAQYATYQPPASAASTTLAYLKSPFEDPEPAGGHTLDPSTAYGHGVEPTGASYHTAYGSESEHGDTQADLVAPRAFSPPPPSYRTNAGAGR